MEKTFYSNGKLMITGEYVALDGATVLALPTKFGQDLAVNTGLENTIRWKSFDYDGSVWFEDSILFSEIIASNSSENDGIKATLLKILHEAFLLNPDFLKAGGYSITTKLTFPRTWGLGTSSTVINNIAQWTKVDAFTLLKNSFGGSGYDIACAQNDHPVLFHLKNGNPVVKRSSFQPEFFKNIWFVYLNQKQNSKTAIASYKSKINDIGAVIPILDQLTQIISTTESLSAFMDSIVQHENTISTLIDLQPVQQTLFSDFDGTVKSLGAWGGDFVMAISQKDPTDYFFKKGYETVLPYSEMIL